MTRELVWAEGLHRVAGPASSSDWPGEITPDGLGVDWQRWLSEIRRVRRVGQRRIRRTRETPGRNRRRVGPAGSWSNSSHSARVRGLVRESVGAARVIRLREADGDELGDLYGQRCDRRVKREAPAVDRRARARRRNAGGDPRSSGRVRPGRRQGPASDRWRRGRGRGPSGPAAGGRNASGPTEGRGQRRPTSTP